MTADLAPKTAAAYGQKPYGGSLGYRPQLYNYGPQVRKFWFSPYMHIADGHEFVKMQNIAIARADRGRQASPPAS